MAALMVGQIRDNSSAQDIDQILDSQPTTLEQLYAQIMERINSQAEGDAALARRVLSELLTAQRPPTIATMLDVVGRDAGWERTSDPIQVETRIAQCVQCCRGLVARSNGNIGFVHLTVQQYLEHHGVSSGHQRSAA
jgi:hypothetical protein